VSGARPGRPSGAATSATVCGPGHPAAQIPGKPAVPGAGPRRRHVPRRARPRPANRSGTTQVDVHHPDSDSLRTPRRPTRSRTPVHRVVMAALSGKVRPPTRERATHSRKVPRGRMPRWPESPHVTPDRRPRPHPQDPDKSPTFREGAHLGARTDNTFQESVAEAEWRVARGARRAPANRPVRAHTMPRDPGSDAIPDRRDPDLTRSRTDAPRTRRDPGPDATPSPARPH
jgi:hypothetical protein